MSSDDCSNTDAVARSRKRSAKFLLPPFESVVDREAALASAIDLLNQAIEKAVRAGKDDLAMKILELAQSAERESILSAEA